MYGIEFHTLFGSLEILELIFQAMLSNGTVPCGMHFLWANFYFPFALIISIICFIYLFTFFVGQARI